MTTTRTDIEHVEHAPEIEAPPAAPTELDLPDSDGMPLDNERQGVQMRLLTDPAKLYFEHRADMYVGSNMFVYFSPDQQTTHDFRGPDVFVVTETVKRERRSWVSWQEGKGPDVVIEILSESTQRTDRTVKKHIYATRLRAPVYVWYDPFTGERAGFILHGTEYLPIDPDAHDRLPLDVLGLTLVRWHGIAEDIEATWLRWATPDGVLLPTREEAQRERAEAERQRADEERQRAEGAERAAESARAEAEQERRERTEMAALLARYRERFGDLGGEG